MEAKKREIGVDLVKVFACVWVVALHTLRPGQGLANRIVFLMASVCMPLFFICNGYVLFLKRQITYGYVLKKVARILSVCFMWELLHAVAYFLVYNEFRNFIQSFILDFFQEGLFYHFWFMGTLIILYMLLPLLKRIQVANSRVFVGIVVTLGSINILIDVLMVAFGKQFILDVPSNLRLWNYLFYYMFGGICAEKRVMASAYLKSRKGLKKIIWAIVPSILMVVWIMFITDRVIDNAAVGGFYSSLPVIIAAISIFAIIGLSDITWKWVTHAASLIMGIYIIHPFVLAVMEKFIPAFINGGSFFNFAFWILTVLICAGMTFVINKIPVIKLLTKL